MGLVQKNTYRFLSAFLALFLCLNIFSIDIFAKDKNALDVDLIDKKELGKWLVEDTAKFLAAYKDNVGIYGIHKISGLISENKDMVNMFLPDDKKINLLENKVSLEEQDGKLLSEVINPWNLYGKQITDFVSEKYDSFVYNDNNLDKKFSRIDDFVDMSQLALNTTKVLKDFHTDDVDGAVHLYVSGVNFITSFVEAAQLDKSILVKGSIGICKAATKYAENVMSSDEYKKFKEQYDTKLGFTRAFMAGFFEELCYVYSNFDEDINRMIHDEELWEMIFPHTSGNGEKGKIMKTITGYRAPAPFSIIDFAPGSIRFGGSSGAHVIVTWGTSIEDFDVRFYSN